MPEDVVSLMRQKCKKLLFYHQDGDGISSAALVLKVFPDFLPSAREGPMIEDDFLKVIVAKNPGLLLFLDLPVDQESKKMEKLRQKLPATDIIVIDHHIPEVDLNDLNIHHLNPRFENKDAYIPTSYLIYMFLKREFPEEMGKLMWIATIGVISDYAFKECRSFLTECKERFPELLDTELDENIFSSKLGMLSRMMSSAITLKGLKGANYSLKVLVRADSCDDFIKNKKIIKWHNIVKDEMKRLLEEFEKKSRSVGKVVIFKLKSRLNVSSVLASILARKHPERTILLTKKSSAGWKVSVRCQNPSCNLGSAVKKSAEGIGMGGGHERAAGALVKNWKMFEKRFLREISKA
jgi:single-stranded DNA-specific DHH superfamily exonuclease